MPAVQANEDGLGGKLAKWSFGLLGRDGAVAPEPLPAPPRDQGNGRLRREVDRRRALYDDIGQFLFSHDLDLTPLNFGLAHDYITGNDLQIEKAVRAILQDRGTLTNGLAENIIAQQRVDEITADGLAEMLDQVEANVEALSVIADQSTSSAKDYGAALQREASELASDASGGDVIAKLVAVTRTMIEHTREVESKLRDGQKQTRLLQKNLETARKAAEQDHLTGLPNRRAFETVLREETQVAREQNETLSVAFCDIDHFKTINDTHGHDAGDRVLKFVAGLLARVSDDRCHVARHGGEEFVMLFRGKTVAEACVVVDEARQDMSERNLVDRKTGERMEQVTFSGGVADVFGYPEPRDALKAADRALYLAKEHGRNRVYIARESD
ncbi:GGDEF domain-containing protein [Sphingobium sufflavum]|uniref:GGDEF domain-containing protein n=1 Tax=Sphingobium sufflavum TaxID=1129547 RepID=UPI001F36EDCD|nr:GGDEF domain-containing protein [Sphingobium sufflavum]MCE7796074.1 GGDEF domain-containing protein [Sphingobium sufflavum]